MKSLFGIVFVPAALAGALFLAGCRVLFDPDFGKYESSPYDSPSPVPIVYTPQYALPPNYIPRYAVDEAERYRAEFLARNAASASDLTYRFFYNEDGEAYIEYTVTPKGGYPWNTPVWIGRRWGNSRGSDYTVTQKRLDEAAYCMEERRKDRTFSEIEKVVLQIAADYDYDYYGYDGTFVQYRDPDVKKAVCDGYANAVFYQLNSHPLVASVEKWIGGNHAWNVINLKDGRKLYCDATWYDGNSIDDEGYVVHVPQQNPWNLTFDPDEFNTLGGVVDNATGRLFSVHFGWAHSREKQQPPRLYALNTGG
jgi:hypothetical protein